MVVVFVGGRVSSCDEMAEIPCLLRKVLVQYPVEEWSKFRTDKIIPGHRYKTTPGAPKLNALVQNLQLHKF